MGCWCRGSFGGSSPLTRGTRPDNPHGPSLVAVHPRLRGEHSRFAWRASERNGSSPLTRGTQPPHEAPPSPSRFIPAYAGNTESRLAWVCGLAVHPRLRGEHVERLEVLAPPHGSSPLTRGTLRISALGPKTFRFIPAYAGNTSGRTSPMRNGAVHPRLRGEHTKYK